MRHASIQTTMNVYGRSMSQPKREAQGKVSGMLHGSQEGIGETAQHEQTAQLGVERSLQAFEETRKPLSRLVAGDGFEPPTFGL
jgi:hypothetical protein